MKLKKILFLSIVVFLISACNSNTSSRNSYSENVSSKKSSENINSSLNNYIDFVYSASGENLEFNVELGSEPQIINVEDIKHDAYYRLFAYHGNDKHLKDNYKVLTFLRQEGAWSEEIIKVNYKDMYLENGGIRVTANYSCFKDFLGDAVISYFRDLILIPNEWLELIQTPIKININRLYLDDISSSVTSLAKLLPWTNDLKVGDIERLEFSHYYAHEGLAEVKYSEDKEVISEAYRFLFNSLLKVDNTPSEPQYNNQDKITVTDMYNLVYIINGEEYHLNAINKYFMINGFNYEYNNDFAILYSKISEPYCYKFVNESTNGDLYHNDVLLERIPDLFNLLKFKKIERSYELDCNEDMIIETVLDLSSDLYLDTKYGPLYIIDSKHFAWIDINNNTYDEYELVGKFDFSSRISREYDDFVVLYLQNNNWSFTSIKLSPNKTYSSEYLLSLVNEYHNIIADNIIDENEKVIYDINIENDTFLDVAMKFNNELEVQYIRDCINELDDGGRIILFNNLEELTKYANNIDNDFNDSSKFEVAITKYDDEFFKNNSLIIIELTEFSGSNSHKINSIGLNDGTFEIHMDYIRPSIGTTDIASWQIIIEVEKSLIGDISSFKIVPTFIEEHIGV